MEPEALLAGKVAQLRRRLRLLVAQRWIVIGLAGAAAAGCLLAAVSKLRWAPDAVDWIGLTLAVGALVGLAYGWTRRVTPLAAAQLADRRLDLKERLSSGVLLSAAAPDDPMVAAQVADAAEHSRDLRPGQVFPWRLPREARYLGATAALLLGILYVPELPFFHSDRERAEQAAMADAGKMYQEAARELERHRTGDPSRDEILRRVAANLKQLGREQQRGRISKKEALLRANQLQQAIREAERRLGARPNSKSLEQAAAELQQAADRQAKAGNQEMARSLQELSRALSQGDLGAAQREFDRLAKQFDQAAKDGQVSPEEMRRAAEAFRQMAQSVSGSRAEASAQKLREGAEQLEKAAAQAEQLQQQLAQARTPEERAALQEQLRQVTKSAMNSAST
jgi:hypothetical protein